MKKMVVAQYAKWPQLGKVKTRLEKDVGAHKALEVHMELVKEVANKLRCSEHFDHQLWLSTYIDNLESLDAASRIESERLLSFMDYAGIAYETQHGDSLGERMAHTFRQLSDFYQSIAIVGSDCPDVSVESLKKVSQRLSSSDVAIIPAEDGGYVLLAMRATAVKSVPENWLEGISWGSSAVLEETLERSAHFGLSVHLLSSSWDVDEIEDYRRWLNLKNIGQV